MGGWWVEDEMEGIHGGKTFMEALESFSLSFGVEEDEEEEVWGLYSVDLVEWEENKVFI